MVGSMEKIMEVNGFQLQFGYPNSSKFILNVATCTIRYLKYLLVKAIYVCYILSDNSAQKQKKY